ncbi:hypothetical protein T4A_3634 [Trichinella pseudospiralis]|uniref:Uncharacterized protein n=1 Tax=Trichinella pseudospiralis TaxID=6337 RepID=A0A0V1G5S9_TRIPS|nr:hypothetical protein T4A_3634 [Trichinella pseudospiralis]KRY93567.1 hypothetical protein T4D_11951 [Trichinella pseudospiralis]
MMKNLCNDDGFLQLLSGEFLSNKWHRKLSRKLNEFLLYDSETVGHVDYMELKTRTLNIEEEASFSTCSRLLSLVSDSRTHEPFLCYNFLCAPAILESISNEELLRRFHKARNPRLQLY